MKPIDIFNVHKNKRITAIGELLVEFIPENPKGLMNESGKLIKTASGSAGIFACAVANLGGDSGFIGQLGKDALSQFVYKIVEKQGVDMDGINIVDNGQVGLTFVEYTEEGRNFQFYRDNSVGSLLNKEGIKENSISTSAAIHYPGMLLEMNASIRKACETAVEYGKKYGTIISFDPNIRKELIKNEGAIDRLREAIKNADIVSPTLEEAKIITHKKDINEIINELHRLGPKLVAITQDAEGAIVSCGGEKIHVKFGEINAVDATGAGDTFAAALIFGILNEWTLEEIAVFANGAASYVCTIQGVIGIALPTRNKVDEFISQQNIQIRYLRN